MNNRVILAVHELEEIQCKYDVSFLARGGSYGSSKLVIRDNRSGEESPVGDVPFFLQQNQEQED